MLKAWSGKLFLPARKGMVKSWSGRKIEGLKRRSWEKSVLNEDRSLGKKKTAKIGQVREGKNCLGNLFNRLGCKSVVRPRG